jgi:transcriptional regulator with XRE-family HTH domain
MENQVLYFRAHTSNALVAILGEFVRHHRLQQNKTQEELARIAGINRTTLVEFEKGKRPSLITFIQLLRALDKLQMLAPFEVKPELSPIMIAEMQAKMRKRASAKKKSPAKKNSGW